MLQCKGKGVRGPHRLKSMLYADTNIDYALSGHVDDPGLKTNLPIYSPNVVSIQADGDELERCCEILGRPMPPCRVYTFRGANAQEIAANWGNYRGQ